MQINFILLIIFGGLLFMALLAFAIMFSVYGKAMFLKDFMKNAKARGYALANYAVKNGEIVFFGDSLTEMFHVSHFYPHHKVHNRGISGDTTKGMLARIKSNVIKIKPKTVFFLGGANDLNKEIAVEEIAQNITQIISILRSELPNTKIIVQSLYPLNPNRKMLDLINYVAKRKNEDVIKLNEYIRNICEIYEVTYVNTYDLLVKDGVLDAQYCIDGLHVNSVAYEVIAKTLEKYVD